MLLPLPPDVDIPVGLACDSPPTAPDGSEVGAADAPPLPPVALAGVPDAAALLPPRDLLLEIYISIIGSYAMLDRKISSEVAYQEFAKNCCMQSIDYSVLHDSLYRGIAKIKIRNFLTLNRP